VDCRLKSEKYNKIRHYQAKTLKFQQKKILIVATGIFLKGGIERYTRYQYKALQELYGSENVYLVSLLGEESDNSFEEKPEVEYVQGGIRFVDKITFLIKCIFLVRKCKIDTIICNHRQLSIIGYLCKKIFRVKYITNVYGLEIWSGMNRVETMALFRSDRLIGDCNFIMNYIQKHFHYPAAKMDLLYDAVDVKRFSPREHNEMLYEKYNIPKDKFLIATIGRLVRNKGHEIMIKTLPLLDESIVYLIVGGGNRIESLRKLVSSLNLQDRVIFTGRVPESELVDCYNIADLIVLLSTFDKNEGEGLPLGLIEASACGKPIICGNEDGSQDAISEELPNGKLIDPLDQNQLKEAINLYYRDRNIRFIHGTNGRKFVIENFEYEKFKEKQKRILNFLPDKR